MLRGLLCFALAATVAADKNLDIVENAAATDSLSSLVTAVSSVPAIANALAGPGPFTVFAPSNDAFAKITVLTDADVIEQILYYHVISGKVMSSDLKDLQFPESLMTDAMYTNLGGKGQITGVTKDANGAVTINFGLPGADYTATVTTADVECSNGVVHIIDNVLMFPKKASETAVAGLLLELAKAVTKAELLDTVDDTPSLTIFAPTDDAMKAANWESLTVDELKEVLIYHVVVGTVATSDMLTEGQKVTMAQGSNVTVTLAGGVKVNDANVVAANILIKNGVVHVIDKVLMPPSVAPTVAPTVAEVPAEVSGAGIVKFTVHGSAVVAAMALLL